MYSSCLVEALLIIKQVDNTLFCVDLKNLERHSEPIRNIFEIPPSVANEGTESNPIFLEGLSAEEFSSFLSWIYHVCVFVYLLLYQDNKSICLVTGSPFPRKKTCS